MNDAPNPNCPHCNAPLPPGALICVACHRFVYESRLKILLYEAQRLEAIDPILAATAWRQSLPLLPPDSLEAQQIAGRVAALSAARFQQNLAQPSRPNDTLPMALLKTGGSMAVSMFVYSKVFDNWQFAVGFVLLILIHELGHTLANWHYGIRQSPPIFVPFVGAVIMLRQNPPDAKAEAVIGIAGPIAGTFGALGCYTLFLYTHHPLLGLLALWSFRMNLFNMIPIWPLDGGRVAAGITPALWIAGVVMFLGVMLQVGGYRSPVNILVAVMVFQNTLPRIRDVVFRGGMRHPYYRIGAPARMAILVSYTLLAGLLLAMSALPMVMKWFPVLTHLIRWA